MSKSEKITIAGCHFLPTMQRGKRVGVTPMILKNIVSARGTIVVCLKQFACTSSDVLPQPGATLSAADVADLYQYAHAGCRATIQDDGTIIERAGASETSDPWYRIIPIGLALDTTRALIENLLTEFYDARADYKYSLAMMGQYLLKRGRCPAWVKDRAQTHHTCAEQALNAIAEIAPDTIEDLRTDAMMTNPND